MEELGLPLPAAPLRPLQMIAKRPESKNGRPGRGGKANPGDHPLPAAAHR